MSAIFETDHYDESDSYIGYIYQIPYNLHPASQSDYPRIQDDH